MPTDQDILHLVAVLPKDTNVEAGRQEEMEASHIVFH